MQLVLSSSRNTICMILMCCVMTKVLWLWILGRILGQSPSDAFIMFDV